MTLSKLKTAILTFWKGARGIQKTVNNGYRQDILIRQQLRELQNIKQQIYKSRCTITPDGKIVTAFKGSPVTYETRIRLQKLYDNQLEKMNNVYPTSR